MLSRMDFDMFFGILIFDPKSGFCMGLEPLHKSRFLKWSHFSNIECFVERFFCTKQLLMLSRMVFDMFFGILIF